MPFDQFMRAALYEPELGYYTSGRSVWGQGGDYVTAPQVHFALGVAIARLAIELDALLQAPEAFDLVEIGGGDGTLLAQVLNTLDAEAPTLRSHIRATSIEVGHERRPWPRSGAPAGVAVAEYSSVSEWPGRVAAGLVFSNELLDAFPVHRLQCRGGRLWSSRVHVAGDQLQERFDGEPGPGVRDHLRINGIRLGEGQIAEVCTEVAGWFGQVARHLQRGAVLTVDYGHETESLYAESRGQGTLVCQERYRLEPDPLLHPGQRDITAHVDFGNLRRLGQSAGFEPYPLCSLRVFLLGMGAADERPRLPAERLALRHLLVSEIGDLHRVLLQTRGLPPGALRFGRERLEATPEVP